MDTNKLNKHFSILKESGVDLTHNGNNPSHIGALNFDSLADVNKAIEGIRDFMTPILENFERNCATNNECVALLKALTALNHIKLRDVKVYDLQYFSIDIRDLASDFKSGIINDANLRFEEEATNSNICDISRLMKALKGSNDEEGGVIIADGYTMHDDVTFVNINLRMHMFREQLHVRRLKRILLRGLKVYDKYYTVETTLKTWCQHSSLNGTEDLFELWYSLYNPEDSFERSKRKRGLDSEKDQPQTEKDSGESKWEW